MRIAVLITTCDRPDMLQALVSDIEQEATGLDVRIVLVDDGSMPPAWPVTKLPITPLRNPERLGILEYWRTVNLGFSELRTTKFDYLFMLPDDVRLVAGFFRRAIEQWMGISEKRKICLSLLSDGRQKMASWTRHIPYRRSWGQLTVWNTQWTDLCFISTYRLLQEIDYRVAAVIRLPEHTFTSSGVGRQISQRLHAKNYRMYHVAETLVIHGDHESRMHGERRRREPLIAA